jgi:cell division protein FtsB
MKYLIAQRHIIRQNFLPIIAFVLFCYFSFHILMGERSYLQLVSTEKKVETLAAEYERILEQRVALEDRVVRMRPGSIDLDLLEERSRHILGYVRENEDILL